MLAIYMEVPIFSISGHRVSNLSPCLRSHSQFNAQHGCNAGRASRERPESTPSTALVCSSKLPGSLVAGAAKYIYLLVAVVVPCGISHRPLGILCKRSYYRAFFLALTTDLVLSLVLLPHNVGYSRSRRTRVQSSQTITSIIRTAGRLRRCSYQERTRASDNGCTSARGINKKTRTSRLLRRCHDQVSTRLVSVLFTWASTSPFNASPLCFSNVPCTSCC